jgi:phenylpyruvate tautomerase PptA (4-oxalocrotonate tautomerase family)
MTIKTNTRITDKNNFAKQASKATAEAVGKPENYVMTIVEDEQVLVFAGNDQPAAYIELKSINLPESETANLSASLCQLVNGQLDIDTGRIYIEFSSAQRHMWGWNGGTF